MRTVDTILLHRCIRLELRSSWFCQCPSQGGSRQGGLDTQTLDPRQCIARGVRWVLGIASRRGTTFFSEESRKCAVEVQSRPCTRQGHPPGGPRDLAQDQAPSQVWQAVPRDTEPLRDATESAAAAVPSPAFTTNNLLKLIGTLFKTINGYSTFRPHDHWIIIVLSGGRSLRVNKILVQRVCQWPLTFAIIQNNTFFIST